MIRPLTQPAGADRSRQALLVWSLFFITVVILNGTIPFALGVDLHAWTASTVKAIVLSFVIYAVFFLAVPLVLIKGWPTVRRPAFVWPLGLAMAAITFAGLFPGIMTVALAVLVYLHWRFDLSGYGFRSRGWLGDLAAVALMGLLALVPAALQGAPHSLAFGPALATALNRWFANPAASVENLFYFGFLTERLSGRTGRWLTPPLIGLMYTAHEMSNPEYWYGQMSFVLVFVGVTLWAGVYLWRRNAVAIWLGDGFYRFVGRLI